MATQETQVTERFTHMVKRRFNALGTVLEPGRLVDASAWQNVNSLVSQLYLEPLPPSPFKVYDQQRRQALEGIARLDEEQAQAEQNLAAAEREQLERYERVNEYERAVAQLSEERRLLEVTRRRIAELQGKLGLPMKYSGAPRTPDPIPERRERLEAHIAYADQMLAQLGATS